MSATLRDRYVLEGLLGSGGMADVHRATDSTLERSVAVKVLRDVAGDETARHRFVAEARTLARLSHRNLVTVLDAGIGEDDDRPFLVMELVEGRSLDDALRAGPLPPEDAASVGAQLAAGLAYAHERGVVHRDVKPGNVLLSHDGRVKLADFGIARLLGDTARHTRTGTAIGTAAYLAPEQVRGEDVTGAADTYSLGLVLLESLTGTRAFPGSPTEAALARLQRDPEVPDTLGEGWVTLLTAMTASDPADRPEAAEVARLLAEGAPEAAAAAASTMPSPAAVRAARALPARRARWPFEICAASWAMTYCSASTLPSFMIRPEFRKICWLSATKAFSAGSSITRIRRFAGTPAARNTGAAICASAYSTSASRISPAALAGTARSAQSASMAAKCLSIRIDLPVSIPENRLRAELGRITCETQGGGTSILLL